MEKKTLTRREKEQLRHRQEMLEGALVLFSEKGYHNVSMQEIAREAEFAVGTLYKFFENKEKLYKALVLEQAEKFQTALDRAIKEPGEEIDKIRNYVRVKGEVFISNAPMMRLYFAEATGASFNVKAGFDSEIRVLYEETLQGLATVFKTGIKKKHFKNITEPYYLAVAIDSLSNAFLFLWMDDPKQHPYQENVDNILNIFFNSLVTGSKSLT
ncbi:MAG: TetR/AcrR family transcriptional regulator [Deltaproteobacteria bacterium]|nr:TetR/AcrR family transcriptional regulator [Deltaproteobacteria bacterium]